MKTTHNRRNRTIQGLIVLALMTSSLVAILPTASATLVQECVDAVAYTCVRAGGSAYGEGTCEGSDFHSESNTVEVRSSGVVSTGFVVTHGCSASSFSESRYLSAEAWNEFVAYAQVRWSERHFGDNEICTFDAKGYNYVWGEPLPRVINVPTGGCPNGDGPPAVPAILP